jgi:biuret amidohydrolase
MDKLDPVRTALVVVHMVKGGGRGGRHPVQPNFPAPSRGERTHGSPETAAGRVPHGQGESTKVVFTAVTYQPGYPGVTRNSRLFRTLIDSGGALLEGTPAVEVIDDLAPRPGEPVVRGQATNGFDRTELDTILRQAGVDTLVLVGIATDVAVESTARAACDLGYRTIVVSDACDADSDEAHAHALEVIRGWFGETAAAAEVLSALGDERTDSGKSAEATRTAA